MRLQFACLMLATLVSACGGSASSEVESSALPDLSYQLAIELLLTDEGYTGNTGLLYGGSLQLWRKNQTLALSGTDHLEIRNPLTRVSEASIANNPDTMRCCVLSDVMPEKITEQRLQRPQLLFWRLSNVEDSFMLTLPPTILLPEFRLLQATDFGYKTVGNGTMHFYWAADDYPTQLVIEQPDAQCPVGQNPVRLVRSTTQNQLLIPQFELGACKSKLLKVSFNRVMAQNYRTTIQNAEVTGTVTVSRVLNLTLPD